MDTEGLDPEYIAKRAELPLCVVCERPMRPTRALARDWPATVSYGTVDQCKTCYNRKYQKGLSVAQALKPTKAKVVRQGRQGVKIVEVLDLPRQEVASRWTAAERSAALQICSMAGRAEAKAIANVGSGASRAAHSAAASDAAHVLEMLGFFDSERVGTYGMSQILGGDPKN